MGPRPDFAVNLGKVVQRGGEVLQKQSRCKAGDMTQPCPEWDKCWVENSRTPLSQCGTLFLCGLWSSVLWEQKKCIFLLTLRILKTSREVFRQRLQNYPSYSVSVDLVRSWTGAVWTCTCYGDRPNNLIIVQVHTSFLEYNPFVECWEEEWSLWWWWWWSYSCRQSVMSASHMWKLDQTLKSPILW